MNIHLVISTNNNTVNAIPLLMDKFKDDRVPVILSSELAKNSKWTANLKYVLEKKGLHPIIYHFPDKEDEMNNLLKQFKDYDSIYFNISGGKKNQQLQLLSLYIERNRRKLICGQSFSFKNLSLLSPLKRKNMVDRLIYMDNEKGKSIVKIFSKGFKFEDEIEPEYLLDLEDISNLYGYTCTTTNEKIEDLIFTPEKLKLPIDKIRQINKDFLENLNYAILIYQYFCSPSVECDENSSVKEQIIKYLKVVRQNLGQFKTEIDNNLKQQWNNELTKLETIKNKYKYNPSNITKEDWDTIWHTFNSFLNETSIDKEHWDQLINCIIDELKQNLQKTQKPLISDPEIIKGIREIYPSNTPADKETLQKEIMYDEIPTMLGIDKEFPRGLLFEDMLAVRFYDIIKEKKPEMLPRFYKNIYGYNLGYDNNGNAYITENNEPNVEFDFVYVTNFGIIYSFEAKSFDIKGETVKSKSYSTTSQGGVFSSNIILTPIQKKHIEDKKINKFMPQSIKDKINAIQKYNVKLWYFDEIEKQLEKIL